MGAAQAAAVGPLGFPGADALDEDRLLGAMILGSLAAMSLSSSRDVKIVGVLAVEVLFGFQAVPARGHDGDAVVQLALTFRGLDQGGEVADEAAGVFDGGVEHDLDVGVLLHLFDQVFQVAPIVVAPGTGHQVPGLTAQFIALFHQVGLKTHVGDGEGRFHAGDPAADDQGGFGDREGLLVQGFQPHHPGHDAPDQVLGFFQGLFRLVHVHPGVLVPDVGHIEEVGVEARLSDGLLEHGHVGPGAAGSHHHPVELVFLDEIQDLALGVGGTGEQVLVGHRHPRQGGHVFGEGRDVDHAADVNAAVADEDADAGLLALDVRLRRQLFDLRAAVPRAAANSSPAAAAAAEASITDWGISLGPWKAPQTKIPSRLVVTGAKGEVQAK